MDKPEVLKYPDPRLRRIAEKVTEVTPEIRERAEQMFEVMKEDHGIGLAAPQIGWNVRLFVMNVTGEPGDNLALINPVIANKNGRCTMEEGCLSLPGIYAKVVRPEKIVIEGTTLDGEEVAVEAEGLNARCILHEYDHLDGILFIDKVAPAKKRTLKKKLKKLEEIYKERKGSVAAK